MKEIWKDVFRYEKYYQVSNLGRIKSKDRLVERTDGVVSFIYSKIKKVTITDNGNVGITLTKDGVGKMFMLARLVYKAFNPEFDSDDFSIMVLQKDGNKQKNSIDNLYIKNRGDLLKSYARSVICVTTKKEFKSALEASRYYKCDRSGITKCCKKKRRYCGYLEDGTVLQWEYLDEYEKIKKEEIDLELYFSKNKVSKNTQKVICITTDKEFNSITEAEKYYKISSGGISRCCNGIQKYAGKLEDDTKLIWRYLEKE